MRLTIDNILVDDRPERAVACWQFGIHNPPDERLFFDAISNQVCDRNDLEPVNFGENLKFRHPRHGSVIVHDLAYDGGRLQSRNSSNINAGLGLPNSDKYTARFGSQWENMPRAG